MIPDHADMLTDLTIPVHAGVLTVLMISVLAGVLIGLDPVQVTTAAETS